MLQLSVTALFYLEDSRKTHLRGVRACRSKDARGRAPQRSERERALCLLFLLPSPPGLSCVNWASQECCLFYLRSSLRSSDLPFFSFPGLFSSLSFSHCHFGLLFRILTTGHFDILYFLYHSITNIIEFSLWFLFDPLVI